MNPRIAVAHYPEGAGHATRMLAVARTLEDRGATVILAGGGPGTKFIRLNGYEPYIPTIVDFIDTRQHGAGSVLTDSLRHAAQRVRDLVGWLRRESPTVLVTDDMFATMAATTTRIPVYHLTHNMPGLYRQFTERAATTLLTWYQTLGSRAFFYPAVWEPCAADPDGVIRVPPIALVGNNGATIDLDHDIDVLLVPSAYSNDTETLVSRLRDSGRAVTHVGGPDWEPVTSLFPYIESANVVVCSGYSTVMEAAVAETPCVVRPFTDEQHGVARLLRETDGFAIAHTPHAIQQVIADPPVLPCGFENGTETVAEHVMSDLQGW